MPHQSYPLTMDISCAKYVLDSVKNKTIMADKEKFAFCLWNLAGYLMKVTLGQPADDHDIRVGAKPTSISDRTHEGDAILSEIGAEFVKFSKEPQSLTDPSSTEGVDVVSILLSLMPMILQIIQALGLIKNS
jgi:hypothetical protein